MLSVGVTEAARLPPRTRVSETESPIAPPESPSTLESAPQHSESHPVVERIVLSVLGICLGAGSIELTMGALYDEPWYIKLTSEQANTSPRDYRKNNFLLRDAPYPIPPPADHRRILILGDSFTFGLGVRDDRAIFSEVVERSLNRDYTLPDVRYFHVMNGGIPGSLTHRWLDLWNRIDEFYQPDLVLLVFFLRDGTRTASIPDFFGVIREEITQRNRMSLLYQGSFTYRRFRDNLDRREVGERYTQKFRDSYFGDEEETEEWRLAQDNLREIRDGVRATGAEVGFVIFPILVELNDRYPFFSIVELLEQYARDNDMPHLNLLPAYLGKNGPSLWVSTYDQHPNPEGHAIAAREITPFVAGLLGASRKP